MLGLVSWSSSETLAKVLSSSLWQAVAILQQTLKDLERAYGKFFARRADFPRFKKKGMDEGFRLPQGCKLDEANGRIFLPTLGWIRYRNSREVLGTVKNVTVSHQDGKWFVSIPLRGTHCKEGGRVVMCREREALLKYPKHTRQCHRYLLVAG